MSEDIDDQETQVQAQTSLYLAEAMFPDDELPDYAGVSSKIEAKHYSAVEASTQLGEEVIDLIKKLKVLQEVYKTKESIVIKEAKAKHKKAHYMKYVKDAKEIKMEIDKKILKNYRRHTKKQLTHGVSVKGRGRQEATGIQTSHKTGTTPAIHKRSKWERLTGQNKEPKPGEQATVK